MSKIYIDIPVVAHETWLLSSYIIDSNGDIWRDNNDSLEKISHDHPYDERNKHLI